MKYHTRPGVTIAKIADVQLFVAAGEARGKVPYIKNINKTGVWFWQQMVDSRSIDEITDNAAEFYGITHEQAESAAKAFFESLKQEGYIIIDEE